MYVVILRIKHATTSRTIYSLIACVLYWYYGAIGSPATAHRIYNPQPKLVLIYRPLT